MNLPPYRIFSSARLLVSISLALAWQFQAPITSHETALDRVQAKESARASELELSLVGQVGEAVVDVEVQGSYAYLGVGPRLVILDIADPSDPAFMGQTGILPGKVRRLAVSGSYAYLADNEGGLQVIDVSNPAAPIETGSSEELETAIDVAVYGSYAYVSDGTLHIFDLSKPAAPTLVPSDSTIYTGELAASGSYAYVVVDEGLRIVDVSNPTAPEIVGSYNTDPPLFLGSDVFVLGSYAYFVTYLQRQWGGYGLSILDVSDPADPEFVGSYNTNPPLYYGDGYDVAVSGSFIYAADRGLRVIDISDPADPGEIGSADLPEDANAVDVEGNYAYLGGKGLRIFDISDSAAPTEVGSYNTLEYLFLPLVGHFASFLPTFSESLPVPNC